MILSAGLGTRLRPVTERYAKPAVPFLNIPLLYYSIPLLEEAGVKSFVFNTHYLPQQVEKLARSIPGSSAPVSISPEVEAPLGSGGGIWGARKHLQNEETFLVCNGDEVILPRKPGTMARFLQRHREAGALASILVMEHPLVGTQFGGVWADTQGNVAGFGKDAAKFAGAKGFHYIGILALNKRIFEYLPEGESNILYDAIAAAIAKGEKVQACVEEFTWFETGNIPDLLHATGESLHLLREGTGEDALWLRSICERFWKSGTHLDLRGPVLMGANARVDKHFQFNGFAVVGNDACIHDGAEVCRSVILPNAVLKSTDRAIDQVVINS